MKISKEKTQEIKSINNILTSKNIKEGTLRGDI
jgi:hypothetical protein